MVVLVGSACFYEESARILLYLLTNVRFVRHLFRCLRRRDEKSGHQQPDLGWIILPSSAAVAEQQPPPPPHTSAPDHRSTPRARWGLILQQGKPGHYYGYRVTSERRLVIYESSEDLPGELDELLHRMFPDLQPERTKVPQRERPRGVLLNMLSTIAWMLTITDRGSEYDVLKGLTRQRCFGDAVRDAWNDCMKALGSCQDPAAGEILVFRRADDFLRFLEGLEREHEWEVIKCAAEKFCDGALITDSLEEYERAKREFRDKVPLTDAPPPEPSA